MNSAVALIQPKKTTERPKKGCSVVCFYFFAAYFMDLGIQRGILYCHAPQHTDVQANQI